MPNAPFTIHERVRWSDCDPMGIIRFDAYTRFFELGEWEMFRSIGVGLSSFGGRFGISLPRRVMHMEYPSPPRLDELLELAVYVSDVGTTSLRINFDAYGDGGLLRMEGYLVLVCVYDGADRGDTIRALPLPEAFVSALAPFRLSIAEARASRAARAEEPR